MAITITQTPAAFQLSTATSNTGSLGSNVTAGNLLVVTIAKPQTTVRTFTVSDDRGGTWQAASQNDSNSGRQAEIWYAMNHPGGATTVTVSIGTGTTSCDCCLIEVSGAATASALDDFDGFDNSSNTNTFYQANATGFGVSNGSIIFAVQVTNGTVTTISADGTYTLLNSSVSSFSGAFLHQYRIAATALTDHRPTVTTTGTTRQGPGACAAFKVAAAASNRAGINRGLVNHNGGLVT